ncbi:MAG: DNA translocase FtsK 4TM domain-containing protein [Deltaproteobacteria bacterium]|nr:DNA translocase FtsK 4TM domain-containing protein [Deltaproteobacteria bacterium]
MGERQPVTKRAREIAGLLYLAAALLLLLCLVSYHPLDPSFTHFVGDDIHLHNLVGSFGSYLSDSLLRLLGASAFLIPIILLAISFKYFLKGVFVVNGMNSAGSAGLIVSASGILAVALADVRVYGVTLRPGGLLGAAVDTLLETYFNPIGAYLILALIMTISLMVMIDLSLVSLGVRCIALARAAAPGLKKIMISAWGKMRVRKDSGPSVKTVKTSPKIEETPTLMEKAKRKKAEQIPFDFIQTSGAFMLPPLTLLEEGEHRDTKIKRDILLANSRALEKKLSDFGVEGKVVEVRPGPVITMYELEPAPGIKINKITNLSDDLALALKAPSIRIIAPIPGKAVVGIEIPNQEREQVHLKDVLDNETFLSTQFQLPIALGKNIVGTPVVTDLSRMPHLLIAGTTGSGKSVSLNAMICSILFRALPDEVKFLMIDPKRLELSSYEGIPHLLHPVVVDPKKAAQVLKWAVEEMERRYQIISELGVKSIENYNSLVEKKRGKSGKSLPAGEEGGGAPPETASPPAEKPAGNRSHARLPYLVIVIDELADLMMVAQRNVEESLSRLAQMARAAGIHLILATQRPSVDVITGIIKANFPTRISFQVSSKVDSRTILDQHGAEKLLGSGDMLFIPPGASKLIRIHGAYVSDKEIERVVEFVTKQGKPAYDESITEEKPDAPDGDKIDGDFDEKYDAAVELVSDLGHASISLVQRYLKIGYNRSARIIERMESEGVVGPSDGVKPRKVLIKKLPR